MRVAVNQNVAHVLAFGRGGEHQAGGQIGRQIFQAVHGEVGVAFDERDFEFLREETFRQAGIGLRHRSLLQFIAGGLDDLQFEAQPGKRGAALRGDQVGLRERERTAARADDDGFFSHNFRHR